MYFPITWNTESLLKFRLISAYSTDILTILEYFYKNYLFLLFKISGLSGPLFIFSIIFDLRLIKIIESACYTYIM